VKLFLFTVYRFL